MSNRHSFPPPFLLLLYSVRVQRNVPQNVPLNECINTKIVSVVSRWTPLQIPPTKSQILYKSMQRSYTCINTWLPEIPAFYWPQSTVHSVLYCILHPCSENLRHVCAKYDYWCGQRFDGLTFIITLMERLASCMYQRF
jgi:hypothetical protein